MALKQVTSNPTVQAVAAVLVAALGVVGVSSVRGTLGVSADPTTRHGEIAVRVDAGGADVTALAAVDPGTTGQVLTVGDAGVPVWRDPAGGLPSGTGFVTVSSGTGGVLTASSTSAADLRTALSTWPGATTVDPMAGSGWTAAETPVGATATWAASTLALSVPTGVSGALRQQYVVTIPAGATAWDIAVRLQATTGAGTTSACVGVYWIFDAGMTTFFGVNVRGDGAIYVSWYTTGAGDNAYAGTTLAVGGGQSWVRLTRTSGGALIAWYGEGVGGALPTAWARRYVLDDSGGALMAPYAAQILATGVGGAPSVDWVATVHAIRTSWSGSL